MTLQHKRIDSDYYDQTNYHKRNATHLIDPKSVFQSYRTQKVLEIHTPGKDDVVLDLGCGWGTFCWLLADRVKHITGLDFSENSVTLCKEKLQKESYLNVDFHHADARDTRLPSEFYDLLIAADLFEHLYPDDSEKVITEAHRLLRSGGHLTAWTPNKSHIIEIMKNRNFLFKKDETHVDYKSMGGLVKTLEAAGFVIVKCYHVESHIPIFNVIERTFLRFIPLFRRRIAILARKP